ncbi:hypothetical protein IFM89_030943 [Coptis chinensis]|uniref:Prephenate/arogenate dehydrogenase domain-containing protein n=1 Tax=Coptis chinensis TaxID=261450 RepID=A0A835MJM4_9MAGN|nr:hypothetical protein IFM89_030943 [Coptis chinensis]
MLSFTCLQQPPRTRVIPSSLCTCSVPKIFTFNYKKMQTCYFPNLIVRAIDAAQPFDLEAKSYEHFEKSTRLKIGIVGFGNFGQFLAKTLVKQGHTVLAYSRSDYSDIARELGVSFSDPNDLCEEHPEVILLCSSIVSTKAVLQSIPFQRLKRSTLFVDVLSVKEFPRDLFLKVLPPEFDILCTHPMFGPESGRDGWQGLNFVYEKVRIGIHRCLLRSFLRSFLCRVALRILMDSSALMYHRAVMDNISTALMLVLKILLILNHGAKICSSPLMFSSSPLMFFSSPLMFGSTRNLSSPLVFGISSLLISSTLMLMGLYCHKGFNLGVVPGIKINNLEIIDARGYNRSLISSRVIEAYLIE